MCEAERQLKKVAFELDMQQTAGIYNPGKIRAMLTAQCDHNEQDKAACNRTRTAGASPTAKPASATHRGTHEKTTSGPGTNTHSPAEKAANDEARTG
jgi:hypothetical protein